MPRRRKKRRRSEKNTKLELYIPPEIWDMICNKERELLRKDLNTAKAEVETLRDMNLEYKARLNKQNDHTKARFWLYFFIGFFLGAILRTVAVLIK